MQVCRKDTVLLRLPPEVHLAAMTAAQLSGVSLNQWATKALEAAAAQG